MGAAVSYDQPFSPHELPRLTRILYLHVPSQPLRDVQVPKIIRGQSVIAPKTKLADLSASLAAHGGHEALAHRAWLSCLADLSHHRCHILSGSPCRSHDLVHSYARSTMTYALADTTKQNSHGNCSLCVCGGAAQACNSKFSLLHRD